MRHRKNLLSQGFTLIEILVVVVIIGILAGVVLPKIMGAPDQARVTRAKQDISAIQTALDLYKLDNGVYPTTEQSLMSLVEKPTAPPLPQSWHQYLPQMPTDPWGRAYQYLNPGTQGEIDIFTYGPTGQPGGTGDKAEIGNWVAHA